MGTLKSKAESQLMIAQNNAMIIPKQKFIICNSVGYVEIECSKLVQKNTRQGMTRWKRDPIVIMKETKTGAY